MAKIKICGITNLADAESSSALRIEYLGFNFYSKSPRYVEPEIAKKIIANNRQGLFNVGIFVDENPERVNELVQYCNLDLVQLHGSETPEYCDQIDCETIKAFQVKDDTILSSIDKYRTDYILLDAHHPELKGGTGETFNWEIAQQVVAAGKKIFLSGGLNAENIAQALSKIKPFAVDICSGAERTPGRKDPDKLQKLADIVRSL